LAERARSLRPDAVLVDHYPFSKWELEPELTAMIEAARAANPSVRVYCSLRDIAPRTRYDEADAGVYTERVLTTLRERFDAVLVHSDPSFTRLDDHFPAAASIGVPVHHTGFVAEPAVPMTPRDGPAVVSAGGLDATEFLAAATRAIAASRVGSKRVAVFLAPGATPAGVEHAFTPHFGTHLARAPVSISRAGYNTATGLLRHGTPAVVVPEPRVSDQEERARLLAEHGVAVAVPWASQLDAEALAAAVDAAVDAPPEPHGFDLDGVAAAGRILEEGS
jgi:predicted glycosyltransferase